MPAGFWSRLNAILQKPLFGTKVIPRDARVDPAEFPEDDFPVYCPKCQYLLRGLPDGRCPECGEPFERSRLLVCQYAQNPLRYDPIFGKLWLRFAVLPIIVFGLLVTIRHIVNWYLEGAASRSLPTGGINPSARLHRVRAWIDLSVAIVVICTMLFARFGFRKRLAACERKQNRMRQALREGRYLKNGP